MPKDIEISISRADLPKADREFNLREVGLEEEDFDLTKAKVWIDDVSVEPSRREKDRLVVKAQIADDGPRTIALTTEAGKLIGVLEGDKIPLNTTQARSSSGHSKTGGA